jgi:hypothetical protein
MQNLEKSRTKMKITKTSTVGWRRWWHRGGDDRDLAKTQRDLAGPGEFSSNLATKLIVCSPHERQPPHRLLHLHRTHYLRPFIFQPRRLPWQKPKTRKILLIQRVRVESGGERD